MIQRETMNYLDYANHIEKIALVISKEEILSPSSKEFSIFKKYLGNDSFEVFHSTTINILEGYYSRQPVFESINLYMFYQTKTQSWFNFLWNNSDEKLKKEFVKELTSNNMQHAFFDTMTQKKNESDDK